MCLHGLDILSMWCCFSSLLCAAASAFQHSHLAKDPEVFVTNCMNNPRSCSARVDEMRVLKLFVFFVPTMFLVSLVPLSRFQQLCFFPFGLHANILGKYVLLSALLHDTVLSPEFFLLSASVCVASFFSNPCLQG